MEGDFMAKRTVLPGINPRLKSGFRASPELS